MYEVNVEEPSTNCQSSSTAEGSTTLCSSDAPSSETSSSNDVIKLDNRLPTTTTKLTTTVEGCGLGSWRIGLEAISRCSSASTWSRLGRNFKHLGLGLQGLGLNYKGLVHISATVTAKPTNNFTDSRLTGYPLVTHPNVVAGVSTAISSSSQV